MTIKQQVRDLLAADATLAGLLPGGVYAGGEISRQETPGAFDANNELMPCAVVRVSSEAAAGPYATSSRAMVTIYFYQRAGQDTIDAAMARGFALLNRVKLTGGVWEARWSDDVPDQEDPALEVQMGVSRFEVIRLR